MMARLRIGTRSLAPVSVLAGLATIAAACATPSGPDIPYKIVVLGAGTGSGSVTGGKLDAPMDCVVAAGVPDAQSTCVVKGQTAEGSSLRFTASPNPGSTFTRFTGCSTTTGNVCVFNISQFGDRDDLTINVAFAPGTPVPAPYDTELLVNPGFEAPIAVGGLPTAPGIWRGDLAQVTTVDRGVTPLAGGSQMLRFDASGAAGPGPGNLASQQWQLVDVRGYDPDIRAGRVSVDASVWFTRVAGTVATDTRFSLRVLAFTGSMAAFPHSYPIDRLLLHAVSAEVIATDPLVWHGAHATLVLPAGTTYLAVEIYAYENITDDAVNEFDGHYADLASLILHLNP